jgi:hypothetical protein
MTVTDPAGPVPSPYPWFGGKRRVAEKVWIQFGAAEIRNYVEPFYGSGAVLLARPGVEGDNLPVETVNDLNAWLTNFWRAVQAAPDEVAYWADWPVSELDLHARGDWLFYRAGVDADFVERLRGDPDWYDAKSSGWWVWGQCASIGSNWGRSAHNARHDEDGNNVGVVHAVPHLSLGRGVNRTLPHLGDAGQGDDWSCRVREYMLAIQRRTRRVRVCCGDWQRVMGPSPTTKIGLTAVFLDPPYGAAGRDDCYGEYESRTVAAECLVWCSEHGDDPLLRIALCGYAGEHEALESSGWSVWAWKTAGGYGNQAKDGNDNGARERIWFSPHCLGGAAGKGPLFRGGTDE